MSRPTPEKIVEIIRGERTVYGLDSDSRIRQAANQMSALALIGVLSRLDEEAPDFAGRIAEELSALCQGDPSALIGWDTGEWDHSKQPPDADLDDEPEQPSEHFLQLVFSSPEAAYFQFPLFPTLQQDFIRRAARKREGAIQHLCLELASSRYLQAFIESLRSNPHFERVEESTEEEFRKAPSHGI
jgi:hypothetical protein